MFGDLIGGGVEDLVGVGCFGGFYVVDDVWDGVYDVFLIVYVFDYLNILIECG